MTHTQKRRKNQYTRKVGGTNSDLLPAISPIESRDDEFFQLQSRTKRKRSFSRLPESVFKTLWGYISNVNESLEIEGKKVSELQEKISPEIQSLETEPDMVTTKQNEKFSSYKTMIVHLEFNSKNRYINPKYSGVTTIDIDIDDIYIEDIVKDTLLSFTRLKDKKHILLLSTSLLRNMPSSANKNEILHLYREDSRIIGIYNKCLQKYSEFNTIHDNISIFHCAIKNKFITKPMARLQTVFIGNSSIPVFNNIKNFTSLPDKKSNYVMKKYDEQKHTCIGSIDVYTKDDGLQYQVSWWTGFYNSSTIFMKGYLYQITGTCWLHCVINLIILSPISNDVKKSIDLKTTKEMSFLEMSNASKSVTLKHLLFSLLKNILLKNLQPKKSDGNILLPIAARVKGLTHNGSEFSYTDNLFGDGNNMTLESARDVFQLILTSSMIHFPVHLGYSIESTIRRYEKPYSNYRKYLIFNGIIFDNVPKVVVFANKIYDLLGGIITFQLKTLITNSIAGHAVCGIILKGKEILIDSNRRIVSCQWSDTKKNTYQMKNYKMIGNRIVNSIYVIRKDELSYFQEIFKKKKATKIKI